MTLALGLMSGTSCDGVSAALAEFQRGRVRVLGHGTIPYPIALVRRLRLGPALSADEVSRLNIVVGERLAEAALMVCAASRVALKRVAVVGSHGQTIYHGPDDVIGSTLQIGSAAIIAERTGCAVVSDFRARDIAAGGEGAPLVPAFDQWWLGRGPVRALQNIGGIGNVTVVGRGARAVAFDTGPGNCLLDVAVEAASDGRMRFDASGRLATRGRIDQRAVRRLWSHPYFRRPPPKSTGREVFNESLLAEVFGRRWKSHATDVLATVTFFTAYSIAESYRRFVPVRISEVLVSGGGWRNRTLMQHLVRLVAPVPVRAMDALGIPAQAKESVAFAWLALRAQQGLVNHLPHTTGARRACVLGSLTPSKR